VIHFKGKDMDIPLEEETTGKYAAKLKKWLKDIMYGNEQHPWGVVVEEIGA
jgi:branched-chain amino acid aminotransferase